MLQLKGGVCQEFSRSNRIKRAGCLYPGWRLSILKSNFRHKFQNTEITQSIKIQCENLSLFFLLPEKVGDQLGHCKIAEPEPEQFMALFFRVGKT